MPSKDGKSFEYVITLVVLVLVTTYFYPGPRGPGHKPPSQHTSETVWPPRFTSDPLPGPLLVGGLQAAGSVSDAAVKDRLGQSLERIPGWHSGETHLYEGPVMVETYGSHGSVDCVYATTLHYQGKVLRRGATRQQVESLLGPSHLELNEVAFYRVEGNQRLGVCYGDGGVDLFELFNGLGARQQKGWTSTTSQAPDGYRFPFTLRPTHGEDAES